MINPAGGRYVLQDADTAFHTRIGQYILATGTVPSHDLFSFSKPDGTWYACEWLAEIALGCRIRSDERGKGLCCWQACLIALYSAICSNTCCGRARRSDGACCTDARGECRITSLSTRGRTFSRFSFYRLPSGCSNINRRTKRPAGLASCPARRNLGQILHGGFVDVLCPAGACESSGASPEWRLWPEEQAGNAAAKALQLSGVGAGLCGRIAGESVWNPSSSAHSSSTLDSRWILAHVAEALSPTFRSAASYEFMVLLFAGLASTTTLIRRKHLVEPLWIVFLAYCSLTSARHLTIYVLVAGPIIAVELSGWWSSLTSTGAKGSIIGHPRRRLTRVFGAAVGH